MVSEEKIRAGFKKAKEDVEGVKNELAFTLKRIAKIEEAMNKQMIQEIARSFKKKNYKKKL